MTIKHLSITIFGLLALYCISCKSRLYPEEAGKYMLNERNGLIASGFYGNLLVRYTWIPNSISALQEANRNEEPYDSVLKEMVPYQFAEIKLSDSSGKKQFLRIDNDPAHYQQRLNYLISGIQDDIFLADGKDTLPCIDHHFERTFSVLPYNKILFTFRNPYPRRTHDKTLIVLDREVSGAPLTLTVKSKAIKKIPAIRTKKDNLK